LPRLPTQSVSRARSMVRNWLTLTTLGRGRPASPLRSWTLPGETPRDLGVAARSHGQAKDSSDEAAARLPPRARSPIDLVEDLCGDGNRGLAMGHRYSLW